MQVSLASTKGVHPLHDENPGVPMSIEVLADWMRATIVSVECSGEKKGVIVIGLSISTGLCKPSHAHVTDDGEKERKDDEQERG